MSSPQQSMQHKPYPPQVWSLGGRPKASIDIPITAVFLALYIIGAITHMTIFQFNRRRGHKFIISLAIFGFCMARIVACIVRIASITRPHNVSLMIAAAILVTAGVVIVFVVNIIFAQRLVRSQHPQTGWHPYFEYFVKSVVALVVISLIMLITCTVQSFYTMNVNTHRIDHDIQLYGATYFAVLALLPLSLVLFGLIIPKRTPMDRFGEGSFRTKVAILIASALLASIGAWYRVGIQYATPVPIQEPMPGYFGRAAFYTVNFTIEIIIIYLYGILRVDRRFHIPNGADGPGSYSATKRASVDTATTDKPGEMGSRPTTGPRESGGDVIRRDTLDAGRNPSDPDLKEKDVEAAVGN